VTSKKRCNLEAQGRDPLSGIVST